MSKADTLLKKATFFERMALYSDRKTFLQVLAQQLTDQPGTSFPGDVEADQAEQDKNQRALIWQALQILQQAGVNESVTGPLVNAVTFNRVDLPSIQRAIQSAIMTGKLSPLAQGPQIKQLRDIASKLSGPASAPSASPQGGGYAAIPKDVQRMLSEIVTRAAIGIPLNKNDGILGKNTRSAMNSFKAKFMGGQESDQQVFAKIKEIYNQGPSAYVKQNEATTDWDQVAKQREDYYRGQSIPPGMPGSTK